jgi:DKNYY family
VDADAASFRPLDGPYASDARRVYWMGKVIDGADPATFRVLNAAFECSADAERAYYRQTVIADAEPRAFPPDRAVTNCTETSISFAE